ncbi:hypothetical protein [Chelativorans salis]|uniref:Uncharacterized protein n=1 Tax=Chelativorans salis TaxID=2978478 RepID=A0ABT2LN12_9HYPH|nr:hypothetical protein [Chelativorans sp. EGI FJ00035]MCT7375464.1 hypothetical protein [Chelativorans sp. EGI FJ00035]
MNVMRTGASLLAASLYCVPAHATLEYTTEKTDGGYVVVLVQGEFEYSDDLTRFRSELSDQGASVVAFHSSGGNIAKAMELAASYEPLN